MGVAYLLGVIDDYGLDFGLANNVEKEYRQPLSTYLIGSIGSV